MKIQLCVAAMAIPLLAACASQDATGGAESKPDHVIQPFEVVPLSPEFGPGEPVAVTAARLTSEDELQVLVEGFSCGVPTKLELKESSDAVSVTAYAARYTEGPCPADIVPWYLNADLKGPLDGRTLLSATTGQSIHVIRCKTDAGNQTCGPGPNAPSE